MAIKIIIRKDSIGLTAFTNIQGCQTQADNILDILNNLKDIFHLALYDDVLRDEIMKRLGMNEK